MATIRKNDFIEIEYSGSTGDDNAVFDTTDIETAKKHGIYEEKKEFGPITICVGKEHLISGIDNFIVGKEDNNEYEITLKPEQAFGKKDAKLIKLIATNKFMKENINPSPGLQVNIDGIMGMIKTVSGGRTLVDFNHPLAGKEVTYKVKINKIVTNASEKIKALIKVHLQLKADVLIQGNNATITMPLELPEEAQQGLRKEIKELIPEVHEVAFMPMKTHTSK